MKAHTLARPLVMAVAALALLTVLLVSHAAPAQPAQTITLKMADSFPTAHYVSVNAAKPWMDRVVQLSKTKVEFQYYPSEQLGKQADLPNILRTGVADIVGSSVLAGEFPLHAVLNLPGIYDTTTEGSRIYQQLLKEGPLREEFTKLGARPLFSFPINTYEIFSSKKAVVKAEDAKGLKIRSSGGALDLVVKALGGVPVQIVSTEVYTALQRGTVDAALMSYTGAHSYKVEEITKYVTLGARLGGASLAYAINEQRWRRLPPDVREAMTKANEEIITAITKYQDNQTDQLAYDFEKGGVQINRLSKDEQARWEKVFEPVTEQWITQMEAKGLPGRQLVDAWKKLAGR